MGDPVGPNRCQSAQQGSESDQTSGLPLIWSCPVWSEAAAPKHAHHLAKGMVDGYAAYDT